MLRMAKTAQLLPSSPMPLFPYGNPLDPDVRDNAGEEGRVRDGRAEGRFVRRGHEAHLERALVLLEAHGRASAAAERAGDLPDACRLRLFGADDDGQRDACNGEEGHSALR